MTAVISSSEEPLQVELGARSYPIYVGRALLQNLSLVEHVHGKQVAIVTNPVVDRLYGDAVREQLVDYSPVTLRVEDGELHKNLDSFNQLVSGLLDKSFSRNCTLVALGGGVIGDLCGFVAASYMRGVRFIQIPTTLLAQVDSSVGGKTAVNHALGKNMIGAFHQPCAVVADIDTLNTLPAREFSAGIAEVVKYGLIRDLEFFVWLESNMEALVSGDAGARIHAIRRSCENKAAVVAADETEQGQRALLNLGHTFGHAIETAQSYQGLLHGEAVSVGMCMAARMSQAMGMLSDEDCARIQNLLERANLPVYPPAGITTEQFLTLMARDKKSVDGDLRLVLLEQIGKASVFNQVDLQSLTHVLDCATAVESGGLGD